MCVSLPLTQVVIFSKSLIRQTGEILILMQQLFHDLNESMRFQEDKLILHTQFDINTWRLNMSSSIVAALFHISAGWNRFLKGDRKVTTTQFVEDL